MPPKPGAKAKAKAIVKPALPARAAAKIKAAAKAKAAAAKAKAGALALNKAPGVGPLAGLLGGFMGPPPVGGGIGGAPPGGLGALMGMPGGMGGAFGRGAPMPPRPAFPGAPPVHAPVPPKAPGAGGRARAKAVPAPPMIHLPAWPPQPMFPGGAPYGAGPPQQPMGAAAMPGFGGPQFWPGAQPGFPPVPPAPASRKTGAKLDPLAPFYDRWLDLTVEPFAASVEVKPGSIIEIATMDGGGAVDGTAMLMVRQKHPMDSWGVHFEVAFAGASSPMQSVALQQAFSSDFPPGSTPYLLHWCAGPVQHCQGLSYKQALHSGYLRFRRVGDIKEAWCLDFKAMLKKLSFESEEEEEPVVSDRRVKDMRKRYLELKLDDPNLSPSERMNIGVALDASASSGRDKRDSERGRSRRCRKKRHKRSRRHNSSYSGSDSDSSSQHFRKGSSLSGGSKSRIHRIAEETPGELYDQAIRDRNGFLGTRGGAQSAGANDGWMNYLQTVIFAQFPPSSLAPEKVRELESKAKTLDKLGKGKLRGAADLMTQDFKALELELHGRTDIANELQLVGLEDKMLVSRAELAAAQKSRSQRQRVERR